MTLSNRCIICKGSGELLEEEVLVNGDKYETLAQCHLCNGTGRSNNKTPPNDRFKMTHQQQSQPQQVYGEYTNKKNYIVNKLGIQTRYGNEGFSFCDSVEEMASKIRLEDIQHSLTGINRFTNHTIEPFTVAKHTVLVYHLLKAKYPSLPLIHVAGFVHDFPETYIGDIPGPVKEFINSENLKYLEDKILQAVYLKFNIHAFNITEGDKEKIKWADYRSLMIERALLLPSRPQWNEQGDYKPTAWEKELFCYCNDLTNMQFWFYCQDVVAMKFTNQ
jgi:hypothetical protein